MIKRNQIDKIQDLVQNLIVDATILSSIKIFFYFFENRYEKKYRKILLKNNYKIGYALKIASTDFFYTIKTSRDWSQKIIIFPEGIYQFRWNIILERSSCDILYDLAKICYLFWSKIFCKATQHVNHFNYHILHIMHFVLHLILLRIEWKL